MSAPLRGKCSNQDPKGFTILEVMLAATVMVLAISSSLMVLQSGLRAIDTARYTTLAGQILQSQMEKLRMLNWTQLTYGTTVDAGGPVNYNWFTTDTTNIPMQHINKFRSGGTAARFTQSITAAASPFTSQMKIITLTATWNGSDGRSHSLSYTTRYVQNGISDFFYTSR